jgi:hypothetical protein
MGYDPSMRFDSRQNMASFRPLEWAWDVIALSQLLTLQTTLRGFDG